ncbi:hypothetical protein HH800_06875 [Sphingobium yanoikuyae]|uniref:Uncharacterized protein n=1 Tax=Sphingobium yanoikuyae TaxID=13690 RepID=A0A6M4G4V8_SPHYA|nr:hypothetical protein [Sphingobium yanoikuyae]QJR01946.1 hypothetical protein HH800_06875 [Sphingobium yanoikuyae]
MTVIDLPLYRATARPSHTGWVWFDRNPTVDFHSMVEWLQENVLGGGEAEIVRSEKVARFSFQDDADAALFRLRWC